MDQALALGIKRLTSPISPLVVPGLDIAFARIALALTLFGSGIAMVPGSGAPGLAAGWAIRAIFTVSLLPGLPPSLRAARRISTATAY